MIAPPELSTPPPRAAWIETLTLALLVALAATLLRLIRIQFLGISHFDEGEYVFEAQHFARGWEDGLRHYAPSHAPPLWALMMALASRLGGAFDIDALALSAAVGGLTVGAVFAALDRLSGRAAAWAGALLLTFCPLHLTYSRMALTDNLFTLWYALGLALAVARVDVGRAGQSGISAARLWLTGLMLGIVTGLGMWTKYHGLLIALSTAWWETVILIADRGPWSRRPGTSWIVSGWPPLAPRRWAHRVGSLALAFAIAWAVWSPWSRFVGVRFGPDQMHLQHAQFAIPPGEWPTRLPIQATLYTLVFFAGFPAGLLAALAGVAVTLHRALQRAFGPDGAGKSAGNFQESGGDWAYRPRRWPWIVLGWALTYAAALCLYTPFVRLLDPLTPLAALLGGEALAAGWQRLRRPGHRELHGALAAGLLALLALNAEEGIHLLGERSDGYRLLAGRLEAKEPAIAAPHPSVPLVTRLAHPAQDYGDEWDHGLMLDERGVPLDRYGRHAWVLTDYAIAWDPRSADLFRRWQPYLHLRATFPNPAVGLEVFNPLEPRDVRIIFGLRPMPGDRIEFQLWELTLPAQDATGATTTSLESHSARSTIDSK